MKEKIARLLKSKMEGDPYIGYQLLIRNFGSNNHDWLKDYDIVIRKNGKLIEIRKSRFHWDARSLINTFYL